MRKSRWIMSAMGVAIALAGLGVSVAPAQDEQTIYGSQLMTRQERIEYRAKLRSANTYEEREQIRLEHHRAMQARAKAQGMTLPDTPPAMGGGMGSGSGGMGPGGGMGRNR